MAGTLSQRAHSRDTGHLTSGRLRSNIIRHTSAFASKLHGSKSENSACHSHARKRSHSCDIPGCMSMYRPASLSTTIRNRADGSCRMSQLNAVAEKTVGITRDDETGNSKSKWIVHKLGGTCMGNADRIKLAAQLAIEEQTKSEDTSVMMVVSAMGGDPKVTDMLLNAIDAAASRQESKVNEYLEGIKFKHMDAARILLKSGSSEICLDGFLELLEKDIVNINAMLKSLSIVGTVIESISDFVVGHGELWSARLLAGAILKEGHECVEWLDARDVLVVRDADGGEDLDLCTEISKVKLAAWQYEAEKRAREAKAHGCLAVCTGFIAAKEDGTATTLKRNGSDYSATLMGSMLEAEKITIWTDVDGVYSADPRKVNDAVCLDQLTYNEAWELSYFGARVLHPRTTMPLMKDGIPVLIRNFFNMSAPGTEIIQQAAYCDTGSTGFISTKELIKGFATIDDVAIINVEGTGLVGVPGTASKVFSTVKDAGVNVIMISQASSEHSICFCVSEEQAQLAIEALSVRFAESLKKGRIMKISSIPGCTILATVGQEMKSRSGVSAALFTALAGAGINVKAIAQGCSEYNITAVIDRKESAKALRAVHSRFYMTETPIAAALIGPGLVGKTLLGQFKDQYDVLHKQFNIDLRVLAIASSKRYVLSENGFDLNEWEGEYSGAIQSDDVLKDVTKHLEETSIPNRVIIDCTASEDVAKYYINWLQKGIHVITPNKKANSGSYHYYERLRSIQRKSYTHYFYEATVGAGLPIMSTMKSLVEAGDNVHQVEGVLSGTLSYIFNTLTKDMKFSDVVMQAKNSGYTEPDPRDDLNGMDVARKVCILARESGLKGIEMSDIDIMNLVPEPLRNTESIDEFMSKLPEYDEELGAKIMAAAERGNVLRYVGVIDFKSKTGSVQLKEYPGDHAFATLKGADNILSITTDRYTSDTPLVIRGPGAGAAVTAGGVFSDLLRLSAYFGAPS